MIPSPLVGLCDVRSEIWYSRHTDRSNRLREEHAKANAVESIRSKWQAINLFWSLSVLGLEQDAPGIAEGDQSEGTSGVCESRRHKP